MIYQGATPQSLPKFEKRTGSKLAGWHWTQTANHWSNLEASKLLVFEVTHPYLKARVGELGLPADQRCIWIIDCWPIIGEPFRPWMRSKYPDMHLLFIPPNCTGQLQRQDVVVHKPLKGSIKAVFTAFQTGRFQKARRLGGDEHYAVLCNFKLNVIKPYTPMWLNAGWKRVVDDKDMVCKGWAKCGLRDVFDPSTRANMIKEAKFASNNHLHTLHSSLPQKSGTS